MLAGEGARVFYRVRQITDEGEALALLVSRHGKPKPACAEAQALRWAVSLSLAAPRGTRNIPALTEVTRIMADPTPEQESWISRTLGLDTSAYAAPPAGQQEPPQQEAAPSAEPEAQPALAHEEHEATSLAPVQAEAAPEPGPVVAEENAEPISPALVQAEAETQPAPAVDDPQAIPSEPEEPSLFDRALESVSGAVSSVEDAGKSLLQTGEDLVDKGAAELRQGYDAASDTLGNISLSDLPVVNDISGGKASVVANPNVPAALQGGGKASSGDSRFVAGDDDFFAKSGYVSSLSARASSLRNAAKGIQQAEDAVEKMAKDHGRFSGDDKQLLANAKNLKAVADGMLKLAGEIDKWTGDTNKLSIKKGDEILGHADKLLQAADTVIAIKDLNAELNAFQQKPSADTARAWARGVGKAFDSASALIPSKGLPGFIVDYWKGLLSAPKNYIEAFITLMDVHDKTITEATDFDPDQHQTSDSGKHLIGKRTGWKGELTDIYFKGAFVPNLKDDNKPFLTFMLDHVTSEGCDLWTVKKAVGKALLLAAINRDVPDQEAKDVWLAHVGNS